MTAEEAFNGQLNFSITLDATKAWHKSVSDSKQEFAAEFLQERTYSQPGLGAFIVLDPPKVFNPKRKVKLNNIVNKEVRRWKTKFIFVNMQTKEVLESEAKTKGEAIKEAKKLSAELKVSFSIEISKILVEGKNQVAVIEFVDTIETTGNFYFFGVEDLIPADNI